MQKSKQRIASAEFSIGDIVHHRLFGYRGVIVDVDADFQLTEEWYETVARSRPPKDKPWYHVLVHGATNFTYVAERNLERDVSGKPVEHPMLNRFFTGMTEGRYVHNTQRN